MPTMPESRLKKEIKQYLRDEGAAYFPIPGGSYGMSGAPDLVACYDSRFIAIEGKTYDGSQSQVQKERQAWIESAGGIYVLARRVDDVKAVIRHVC